MLGESSNGGQLRDEEGYYQNIRLFLSSWFKNQHC